MNQLEEMREKCAQLIEQTRIYSSSPKKIFDISQDARNEQAKVIRALPLPEVEQKPIAYMRHRFAQSLETNGYCDGHEWLEVCNEGEKGDDKTPAFPVYDVSPDAKALREENEELKSSIEIFRAAIDFAINTDEPEKFLRRWQHGDFDVLREHWPEAPEGIYPIWMRVKS